MGIFQKSVINKYLMNLNEEEVKNAYDIFKENYNPIKIEKIKKLKEEEYQDGFFRDIFVDVLGYVLHPNKNSTLKREYKNKTDGKKVDGAILKNGNAIVVIELKSTTTKDLTKVTSQAFNYKNNQPNCKYIITSNFNKLRFYIENATEYEEFNLFSLTEEKFKLLYLILKKENLFKDLPLKVKEATIFHEKNISKKLYNDYFSFRNNLFENLMKRNPNYDKLTLFKKSQKLLDRFLFILFAEDKGLLPLYTISSIIERFEKLKDFDAYQPLYEIYKKWFGYINIGRKEDDIPEYNGGLFALDKILDNLIIDDDVLRNDLLTLSAYDFNTEVDVNILGHIFEHSLSDLDEIIAEIEGKELDKKKGKRKKDGVFYTPKYITKYIVENTLGKLCEEKRKELGVFEVEIDKTYYKKNSVLLSVKGEKLFQKLEEYKDYLLSLKVLDPACGSGAFLNQALDFFINEHKIIIELKKDLHKGQASLFNIETAVLENNLYGVDINEESVEIAKLSLWLRTAKRGRKLSSLNNNIKCGNSLIDDPEVAGDKAFNWNEEFSEIMGNGGFDVVIGNPPYGIFLNSIEKKYYNDNYPLTNYKINLYVLFIERMFQILDKGIIHFIIPKSLLFNTYYENIRCYLLKNSKIFEVFMLAEKVFSDAEVGGSLILKFEINKLNNQGEKIKVISSDTFYNYKKNKCTISNVEQQFFLNTPYCEISPVSNNTKKLLEKLKGMKTIKDYYQLKNGLNPGNIKHILISNNKSTDKDKEITWGREINRYIINWGGEYVNYDYNIADSLTLDDIKTKKGMKKQKCIDFALRKPEIFEKEKLLIRKTGDRFIVSKDTNNLYFDTLVHGIYQIDNNYTLNYLLSILNSKFATKVYRLLHDIKGKVFAKISLDKLSSFPLKKISLKSQEPFIKKADLMLELNKKLQEVKQGFIEELELEKVPKKLQNFEDLDFLEFIKEYKRAKKLKFKKEDAKLEEIKLKEIWKSAFDYSAKKALDLKREINKTDKEIDQMVYELYGLTEEEIKIVEGD